VTAMTHWSASTRAGDTRCATRSRSDDARRQSGRQVHRSHQGRMDGRSRVLLATVGCVSCLRVSKPDAPELDAVHRSHRRRLRGYQNWVRAPIDHGKPAERSRPPPLRVWLGLTVRGCFRAGPPAPRRGWANGAMDGRGSASVGAAPVPSAGSRCFHR
jgi:hypothetical protein